MVAYHFPPDLFKLLVDDVPKICRSKNDVINLFLNAGLPRSKTDDLQQSLKCQPKEISKRAIAEILLHRLNEEGDALLGARRELLKRLCEFKDFSSCYPDDQLAAQGFVTKLRELVAAYDARIRAGQREPRPHEPPRAAAACDATRPKAAREQLRRELGELLATTDRRVASPDFEQWLHRLFKAYGIRCMGAFRRVEPSTGTLVEQIDNAIELDGHHYLVEAKFTQDKTDPTAISRCIQRVMIRHGSRGLVISLGGFTEAAFTCVDEFGSMGLVVLIGLDEIVLVLERDFDLVAFLKKKIDRAILNKDFRWKLDASVVTLDPNVSVP